jgi:hypothetical protein
VFLVEFREFFLGFGGTDRCKTVLADRVIGSITVAAMRKKRSSKFGHWEAFQITEVMNGTEIIPVTKYR